MDLWKTIIGLSSVISGMNDLRTALNDSSNNKGLGRLPDFMTKPAGDLIGRVYQVQSIDDRVSRVVEMIQKGRVDPRVREFAVKAVSKKCGHRWCIPERDWMGEIRTLFGAIRSNIRYTRDIHNVDTFQSSRRTLEFKGGDCDDYTITLGSALQAIGFPVKLRIIQTKGSSDFNHIFLLAGLPPRAPSKWIPLDASVNKPPGWHPPRSMIVKVRDYEVP